MKIPIKVPDGISGTWKIESFEITEKNANFENLKLAFSGNGARYVIPGTYKRLIHDNEVIMSNTTAEISDHVMFIHEACYRGGHILINGLGLGVALSKILQNSKKITQITIIEKSKDVITLVAPTYLKDPRIEIIHADALKWKPPLGVRYTTVWHDIWNNICTDNIPQMNKLHRKYGRRCDWQGSWCKELCLYYRKKDKRNGYQI